MPPQQRFTHLKPGAEDWFWMADLGDDAVLVTTPGDAASGLDELVSASHSAVAGRTPRQAAHGFMTRLPEGPLALMSRAPVAVLQALCASVSRHRSLSPVLLCPLSPQGYQTPAWAEDLSPTAALLKSGGSGVFSMVWTSSGEPVFLLAVDHAGLAPRERDLIARRGSQRQSAGFLQRTPDGGVSLELTGEDHGVVSGIQAWTAAHEAAWPEIAPLRTVHIESLPLLLL